jgi:hypothetical protein
LERTAPAIEHALLQRRPIDVLLPAWWQKASTNEGQDRTVAGHGRTVTVHRPVVRLCGPAASLDADGSRVAAIRFGSGVITAVDSRSKGA